MGDFAFGGDRIFGGARTSGCVVGFHQTFAAYEPFVGRKPGTAEYVFWNNENADQITVRNAILASAGGQAAFAAAHC